MLKQLWIFLPEIKQSSWIQGHFQINNNINCWSIWTALRIIFFLPKQNESKNVMKINMVHVFHNSQLKKPQTLYKLNPLLSVGAFLITACTYYWHFNCSNSISDLVARLFKIFMLIHHLFRCLINQCCQ